MIAIVNQVDNIFSFDFHTSKFTTLQTEKRTDTTFALVSVESYILSIRHCFSARLFFGKYLNIVHISKFGVESTAKVIVVSEARTSGV